MKIFGLISLFVIVMAFYYSILGVANWIHETQKEIYTQNVITSIASYNPQ